MRKIYLLFMALLLPTLAALASRPCATDTVVMVVDPCNLTTQDFTIRIPVRLPKGITAEYRWFHNGMAIPNARGNVKLGGGAIAYTIPAHSIKSSGQEFYFLFRLSDDACADCWDSSPLYMICFHETFADVGCKVSGGEIAGDALYLCGANAGGIIDGEAVQHCNANAAGEIDGEAVQVCGANAGGEIDGEAVQVCGANAGGIIDGEAVQVCSAAGGVIGN